MECSQLCVLGGDPALAVQLQGWLASHGWCCTYLPDSPDMRGVAADPPVLFIVGAVGNRARQASHIAWIRAQESARGTPILCVMPSGSDAPDGASAVLRAPLEREAALAMIADWCGPLDDHRFRDLANPFYRLLRLAGAGSARNMLARFAHALREAIGRFDDHASLNRQAHQMAGLAGMFGFPELSEIWRAIERGDSAVEDAARAAMEAAIESIEHFLGQDRRVSGVRL